MFAAPQMFWLAGPMSPSRKQPITQNWRDWHNRMLQFELRQVGTCVLGCKYAAYRQYTDQSKNKFGGE